MSRIVHFFKQEFNGNKRGQSLVEMAIVAPLLIIMLIGVFEVGWALRGYLVLANVNRESARYATKSGRLDFSVKDPAVVGYDEVLSHTSVSLARQLPLEFLGPNPNTTMILSHFVIDTGWPCVEFQGGKPKVPYVFDSNCDCNETNLQATQWFTRDDLIAYPDIDQPSPRYPHYIQTYGISQTTRLAQGSFKTYAEQLTLENNQLNCTILKTGSLAETSINNVIVAEAFYDQPQLLGVPFISNRLTDPIPFYTHTAMRIVASKEAETSDTVGSTCEVYPIIFPEEYLGTNPITGTTVLTDVFEGTPSGGFGWLNWDPGNNSESYLAEELHNPRLSTWDFKGLTPPPPPAGLQPDDSNTSLNIGDWVSSITGAVNSDAVMDELGKLEKQTIVVPVYDASGGGGVGGGYHISHFVKISLTQICLPRAGASSCHTPGSKTMRATFQGYADDECG
jgi:hypothetical protein